MLALFLAARGASTGESEALWRPDGCKMEVPTHASAFGTTESKEKN